MKKFGSALALILILSLVFTFTACGSKDSSEEPAPSEQSQPADSGSSQTPAQPENQNNTPSDQSSTPSQESVPQDSGNRLPENLTPPERSSESSESSEPSSETPVAEVPDKLEGDYTGEFASNTGTGLNLIVKWAASYSSDDSLDVIFQFYLSTYSLQVSDRSGNKLEVKTTSGTETYTFSTKEVNKKDNKLESIYIGQTRVQMSKDEFISGADVKATWDFRGSYSDKSLPEVTAEGKVIKN